jgi:hypothetical protein
MGGSLYLIGLTSTLRTRQKFTRKSKSLGQARIRRSLSTMLFQSSRITWALSQTPTEDVGLQILAGSILVHPQMVAGTSKIAFMKTRSIARNNLHQLR